MAKIFGVQGLLQGLSFISGRGRGCCTVEILESNFIQSTSFAQSMISRQCTLGTIRGPPPELQGTPPHQRSSVAPSPCGKVQPLAACCLCKRAASILIFGRCLFVLPKVHFVVLCLPCLFFKSTIGLRMICFEHQILQA